MDQRIQEKLRLLPAVHRIIADPRIETFIQSGEWSREQLVNGIGSILDSLRSEIIADRELPDNESVIIDYVVKRLEVQMQDCLVPVINGTGILLHTNLGRARIAEQAISQMIAAAGMYSNLEYNIDEGIRGSRHDHVESLICRLTGAEAAMVVNNNAAAVFLVLRELGYGREVIVSRGQLVEIGGSFRISEIMAESGSRLVEVGTTNKTKLSDYEKKINEQTALLLKVHTSNFRIVGFTEEVKTIELVELAHAYQLPLYEDLGSGVLYDLRKRGIGDEPTVTEVLESGVDIVSFSGDKLLGGPQAGIIAGKKKWIERLKKNQLMRMLRVDKVTLAGLEATLRLYLNPERAISEIPALRDLLQPLEMIKDRAETFLQQLQSKTIVPDWNKEVLAEYSEVGGGTLPTLRLPTWVVALTHSQKSAQSLERALRLSKPAVITRVANERVLIDFRTILPAELDQLLAVFENLRLE